MRGICALVLAATPLSALAQDWTAQKCDLYTQAWNWVLETQDMTGVRAVFIEEHQSFIDAGCDHAIEICPVGKPELKLADLLTVLSMNEGMASTFVPFACK